MKKTFHFHVRARTALRAWIEELSALDPNGREMAEVILSDIEHQLIEFGPTLAGVIADRSSEPPLYWWHYYPGHWISYVVRETGFWKWRSRRVIVYSVGERPPDRVVGGSPRG